MVAMQLNALVRKAVSTAKGVRIRMDSQQFEMTVLSSILWFKVCMPASRQAKLATRRLSVALADGLEARLCRRLRACTKSF